MISKSILDIIDDVELKKELNKLIGSMEQESSIDHNKVSRINKRLVASATNEDIKQTKTIEDNISLPVELAKPTGFDGILLEDLEKEKLMEVIINSSVEELINLKFEVILKNLGFIPYGLPLFDELTKVFQQNLCKTVLNKVKSTLEASEILGISEAIVISTLNRETLC